MNLGGANIPDTALTSKGADLLALGARGEYLSDSKYEYISAEEVCALVGNPKIRSFAFLANGTIMVDTYTCRNYVFSSELPDGSTKPKKFQDPIRQYLALHEALGIRGLYDTDDVYHGCTYDGERQVVAAWSHNPDDMVTVLAYNRDYRGDFLDFGCLKALEDKLESDELGDEITSEQLSPVWANVALTANRQVYVDSKVKSPNIGIGVMDRLLADPSINRIILMSNGFCLVSTDECNNMVLCVASNDGEPVPMNLPFTRKGFDVYKHLGLPLDPWTSYELKEFKQMPWETWEVKAEYSGVWSGAQKAFPVILMRRVESSTAEG